MKHTHRCKNRSSFRQTHFILSSIFIGGGTPTQLNHSELKQLLASISDNVSLSKNYDRFIFDNVLQDLAQQTNKTLTEIVAKTVEFPINSLNLEGKDVPIGLFLRPLAIALASVAIVAIGINKIYSKQTIA